MNEALKHFLEDCLSAPSALGCGVRLADRSNHVSSFHQGYPEAAMEKTMLHLANAMALLSNQDMAGQRLAWSFASGKIHVATRPDGALFCLVTLNNEHAIEFFDRMVHR